jgi:hypothetical protein
MYQLPAFGAEELMKHTVYYGLVEAVTVFWFVAIIIIIAL